MVANQSDTTSKNLPAIVHLAKEAANIMAWERSVQQAANQGGFTLLLNDDANIEVKCENNNRFAIDAGCQGKIKELETKLREELRVLELKHKRGGTVTIKTPAKKKKPPASIFFRNAAANRRVAREHTCTRARAQARARA